MKLSTNRVLLDIYIFAVFFALSVLLFWPALFDGKGALQWDAREVHLANLIFSSSSWSDGFLPLWTPYIFNGFPQIADLQVAVFYPINLLAGLFFVFSQKIIFWQLVFHYALAGFGMFLLARHITRDTLTGVFAGIAYTLSGFMIGHSSHLGMQNTAAWLPVVFLLAMVAMEKHSWRLAVLAGGAAGVMILAGHFQTAVFAFFALGLYFIFYFLREWIVSKKPPFYQMALWIIIALMAFLISAVQLLPTFELTKQSQRAGIPLELAQTESLNPQSLRSIITPNYQNVSDGDYRGPWDRTQNDLFLGKLVIVFALLTLLYVISFEFRFLSVIPDSIGNPVKYGGSWITAGVYPREIGGGNDRIRFFAFYCAALAAISLLYSLGSYGFLHRYFYLLPLFDKMRAPSNMMILFDFSVILLASFGLYLFKIILPSKYFKITIAIAIVLLLMELLPQAASNELLYARKNPSVTFKKPGIVENTLYEYGQLSEINKFKLYRVPELERNLAQVFQIYDFGGYNPLSLQRQAAYEDAMVVNPALIDLAGIKYLPCQYIKAREGELQKAGNLCVNDRYFPRAFLVDRYVFADNDQEALSLLNQHNPRSAAVLEDSAPPLAENSKTLVGEAVMKADGNPNETQFSVTSNKPALLVIGQTFYPGWQAMVNGRSERVLRADYLFQAVLVPEGRSTVTLKFTSPPSLKSGLFLSMIGVIVILIAGISLMLKRINNHVN